MKVFVVLRAGEFTERVNGKPLTARSTAVVGVFRHAQDAHACAESDRPGKGWGLCVAWVSPADLDKAPVQSSATLGPFQVTSAEGELMGRFATEDLFG